MTDLLELIASRKSVRRYTEKHIPDADLKKILEAGRLAPSWMNVQPWNFVVVKSQENKDLLCELSIGQQQVKNADTLIVCIADLEAWDKAKITDMQNSALNPKLQRKDGILIRSLEQLIYPTAYMMLEANSLGISSCIIGAFGSEITEILPEVYKKVKQQLNLSEKQIITEIITLGYDNENKNTPKIRKDLSEVAFLEKIGNNF